MYVIGITPAACPEEIVTATYLEHGRLLAQRGLFAGPSDVVSRDLYSEVTTGKAVRRRDSVTLQPATEVSGNSYFGRFPTTYWQRWTPVREVRLELVATGSGRIFVEACDFVGEPRTVLARAVEGSVAEHVALTVPIDRHYDGGALWLRCETEVGQELTVERVRWLVDAPETLRPTAITICTMNRADDCLATLESLARDLEALETITAVYVADQGTDTVDSREGFEQVGKDLGGMLRYIKQPNLGGSGGFTRGLYEVAGQDEDRRTSVLFMDDDIVLEPDMVVRLTAFANHTVEPTIVGGQMLNLLHPHQLHVGAEWASLNTLEPGIPATHGHTTADLLGLRRGMDRPDRQDRRVDAGYNGWWSCLIPAEVVDTVGYPMPFFFQWDDAEYSYRAASRGIATVTLPGAGVWHVDFGWKDWDEWHRYFNLRNSMITAALHSSFDMTVLMRVLVAQFVRYLLGMQYGLAATLIKAIEDFLAGPRVLHDGGVAAMAEIRRIREQYPETQRKEPAETGLDPIELRIVNAGPRPSMERAVLIKRILWRILGKHVHESGSIPADEAHWWHVSLFGTAVVTDASQQGVRVRSYDRARMIEMAKRAATALNRLRKDGPAAAAAYRRALPELTSRANWARLYGVDERVGAGRR
ncbi:glycosyltransferase [Haloechinothrix sp. LS1_15]|uniref:glycosyltransferase n=1 Tax=Haloechinothrix sp. LS1_15 TaxID=2652248 RepID=UPI0037C00C54